tara:strand:- start:520 stop:717 length:198 start_codon:yes stop_codon:yes gene_type:complete
VALRLELALVLDVLLDFIPEPELLQVLVANDGVCLLRILRRSYVLVVPNLDLELEQVWVANDGVD